MLELTTVGFCNFLTDTQLKNGPDLVSLLIFGSRKSLHGSNVYNFKVKRTTVSLTLSWNSNLFFWIFYSRCGFRKKNRSAPTSHMCCKLLPDVCRWPVTSRNDFTVLTSFAAMPLSVLPLLMFQHQIWCFERNFWCLMFWQQIPDVD